MAKLAVTVMLAWTLVSGAGWRWDAVTPVHEVVALLGVAVTAVPWPRVTVCGLVR